MLPPRCFVIGLQSLHKHSGLLFVAESIKDFVDVFETLDEFHYQAIRAAHLLAMCRLFSCHNSSVKSNLISHNHSAGRDDTNSFW